MLPTTGFFKNIECPYHESTCDRPHCHFRHRKKNSSTTTIEPEAAVIPSTSLATYNPTPKSQLVNTRNSHIPISYVPDLAGLPRDRPYRSYNSNKPIYKPTPLSVLTSNKDAEETNKATDMLKYDPGDVSPDVEINFEDLSSEFDMIDELIDEGNADLSFNGVEEVVLTNENEPQSIGEDSEVKTEPEPKLKRSDSKETKKSGCDTINESAKSKSSKHKSESSSSKNKSKKEEKPKNESQSKQKNKLDSKSKHQTTLPHDSESDPDNSKRKRTKKDSESDLDTRDLKVKHKKPHKRSDSKKSSRKHSHSDVESKPKDSKGKRSDSDSELKSKKLKRKQRLRNVSESDSDTKAKASKDSESDSDAKPKDSKHKKRSRKSSESDVDLKRKSKKESKSSRRSKSIDSDKKRKAKGSRSESGSKHAHKSSKRKAESSSDESNDDVKPAKRSKTKHTNESSSESDSRSKKRQSDLKLKTKSKSDEKHKSKKVDSSHQKRSSKPDLKQTKSNKHKSSKSKHKTETPKSDDKNKHKETKEENKKSNDKSKHKEENKKSDDKSKHKETKEENKNKVKIKTEEEGPSNLKSEPVVPNIHQKEDDNNSDYYSDNLSELSDNVDETMQECFKIFTEYKPTEPQIYIEPTQAPLNDEIASALSTKKRIAHDNAMQAQPKLTYTKPKAYPTASQVMLNRFKTARCYKPEIDEQSEIMAEVNKHVLKRPLELVETFHAVTKKSRVVEQKSSSLVDDIINGRSAAPVTAPKRRIAPVLNAGLIQKAKAQIDEMTKAKRVESANKTLVQTVIKGSKRVAHVTEQAVVDIPDVLDIERSKLPVNVRSRFLTMMVEECVKLYYSRDEAHQRAVNEEYKCYERCGVLLTYRNSAMLAINRLRKERQEREAAGLDRILPGESTSSNKDASNPLTGLNFYNNIVELLLSDEELILHGFPRESSTPGRALITPLKNRTHVLNFTENDRICARCLKHYQVDDDGFVLYEEECLYHPLKKRTFRGESIYLCCKSSDEGGCVTSNTHVSDSNANDCDGYQMTMPTDDENDARNYAVYALDCEMCYTTRGLELTRVTIVNADCKTVYETLVKPMNPIIDYNTRFSGITKEQMERTATSILQVQANILHLCNSKTILIGHSLESDMKALKIIHNSVIDTSVLFPHKFGLPHKRALRDLAREYLKKIIQNDISGHDSAEDALTCMELVQWKVKEECKSHGMK